MSDLKFQKGGSSSSPTRTPDTLTTDDTVEVLIGIAEGPIKGLIDGPRSFRADNTPLMGVTEPNFTDFTLDTWPGDEAGHTVSMELSGFSNSISVNVTLAKDTAVSRSGVIPGIDAVDFRILVQQLSLANDKGSFTTDLTLKFEVKKTTDGTWSPAWIADQTPVIVGPQPGTGTNQSWASGVSAGASVTAALPWATEMVSFAGVPNTAPFYQDRVAIAYNKASSTYYYWNTTTRVWVLDTFTTSTVSGYTVHVPAHGAGLKIFRSESQPKFSGNALTDTVAYTPKGTAWLVPSTGVMLVWNGLSWNNATTYIDVPTVNQSGVWSTNAKVSSTTAKEIRVFLPTHTLTDRWEYRVTKLSSDNTTEIASVINWESVNEITLAPKTFYGLAMAKVLGKASDQFTSIPNWSGDYDGRIIKVASNYNEVTRVYTGVWDGTYKLAYTNNTAWVFQDFVENTRYGLSSIFPHTVNKWKVYEWAQHCDVMVQRVDGTYRPRWTYNDLITQPRDAQEMAQYIAGAGGARCIDDGNGVLDILIDKDTPAVAIFTPENIADSGFSYSYTDRLTRANEITVEFINPNLDWNTDKRIVDDDTDIATYGRIPENFIAVACTDVDEALARARRRLVGGLTEKEMVTFSTNRKGRFLSEWEVILVGDPSMGRGVTGRINSVTSSTTVALRDPLTLEPGITYWASFEVVNTAYPATSSSPFMIERRQITTAAGTAVMALTFSAALPTLPEYATFILEATGYQGFPKPYRIMNIANDAADGENISITALELNRNKWAFIDTAIDQGLISYSNLLEVSVDAPKNVDIDPEYLLRGLVTVRMLNMTWDRSNNRFVRQYRVDHAVNGTPAPSVITSEPLAQFEAAPGKHTFSLVAIDMTGKESLPVSFDYDVSGVYHPVTQVPAVRLVGTFDTPSVSFEWDNVPAFPGFASYELYFQDTTSSVIYRTVDVGQNLTYTYDYKDQVTDGTGTPRRTFRVGVRVVDEEGFRSDPTVLVVTNAAPAAPTVTLTSAVAGMNIKLSQPSDRDVLGALVWVSTTNGFTPTVGTEVLRSDQQSIYLSIPDDSPRYVRVAYFDTFGTASLNIAAQQTISRGQISTANFDSLTNTFLNGMDSDINDLQATYGTTASSSASAAAAEAARAAAVIAKTAAETGATNAQASYLGASNAVATSLPSTFDLDGAMFTHQISNAFGAKSALGVGTTAWDSFLTVAGEGRVYQRTTNASDPNGAWVTAQRGMKVVAGRTYKATLRTRYTAVAISTQAAYLVFGLLDSTGAYSTLSANTQRSLLVADGWVNMTLTVTGDALIALMPTVAYITPMTFVCGITTAPQSTTSQPSTQQVSLLKIEDVTDSATSTAQAGIATTKAAAADASSAAALVSQNITSSIAALSIPSTFDADGTFFSAAYASDFSARANFADAGTTFVNVAGEGRVLQRTTLGGVASPSWLTTERGLKIVAGRTYRYTFRQRITVDAAGNKGGAYFAYAVGGSGGAYLSLVLITAGNTQVSNGWQTFTVDVPAATLLLTTGATYTYPMAYLNADGTTAALLNTVQVSTLGVEDVSGVADATAQATIATTKATNSSTSAAAALASQTLTATYQTGAKTAAAQAFPFTFDSDGAFFTNGTDFQFTTTLAGTDFATRGGRVVTYPTVSGIGKVMQINGYQLLTPKGVCPVQAGGKYEVYSKMRTLVRGSPAGLSYALAYVFNGSGTLLGLPAVGQGPLMGSAAINAWEETTFSFDMDAILVTYPTAAYIQFGRSFNQTSGTDTDGTQQMQFFRVRDISVVKSAQLQAQISTDQAASATASAAVASTSQSVVASMLGVASNKNSVFADWTATLPASWTDWNSSPTKGTPGRYGPNYLQQVCTAGGDFGLYQRVTGLGPGWYVVEADIDLLSGSLLSSGMYLNPIDSSNAGFGSTYQQYLQFELDKDINQAVIGAGTAGKAYKFSKLMRFTHVNTAGCEVYLMSNWNTFPTGSTTRPAKTIRWHRASIRPANDSEIAVGTPSTGLQASVTTTSTAVALLNGETTAQWAMTTGSDSGAAFMTARTRTAPGTYTSNIGIGAGSVDIYNPTAVGYKRALSIYGGNALLSGNLILGGKIQVLGTGGAAYYAYQPIQIQMTDGQVYTCVVNTGLNPIVSWDTNPSGLPALSTGESYKIYADSLTPAGFTIRIRKQTASSPVAKTATSGSVPGGAGPTWQMNKADAADSQNGNYTFTATVGMTPTYAGSYVSDPKGPPTDYWIAEMALRGWIKSSGGVWQSLDVITINPGMMYSGSAISVTQAWNVYYTGAVGNPSGNEFGVTVESVSSGTCSITAFTKVDWTAQTSSGEATATPGGQTITVNVLLKNG